MKLVVWDFHGVLETGNEYAVTEMSNQVLSSFDYVERFSDEETLLLYGKKWWEYFAYLLPGEPHDKCLELQSACFKLSDERQDIIAKYIKLTHGADQVIERLAAKGYDQIIISNTKTESLPVFLNAVGITHLFPDGKAFAVDNHVDKTKTKEGVLRDYLKDKEYDEIIVIGDSVDDVALKNVAGGVSFLYAHPGLPFRDCEADYKIRDLSELLKLI